MLQGFEVINQVAEWFPSPCIQSILANHATPMLRPPLNPLNSVHVVCRCLQSEVWFTYEPMRRKVHQTAMVALWVASLGMLWFEHVLG